MGANASRHKAMSYGYMNKEIQRLEAEIEQLLKQAEQLDAEQDAALGSRRGDELPGELKRREERLAKIREAKARLEAEARAQAEDEQRRRDEEQAKREAEGRKRRGKEPAPIDPTPEDKAQTNFTDAEAKVMKQSNKGFDYSYNAQAVVDSAEQIIVAAETTNEANDKQQAVPMAQAALDNLNAAGIEQPKAADGTPTPIPNTADTGYFSKEAVEELEKMGIDPHIATGRQKHHEAPVPPEAAAPSAEAAAPSAEASAKEKMQRNSVRRLVKLSTPAQAQGLSQEGGFPGGSLWTIPLEMCSIVGELTPISIDGGSPMSTITQRIASAFVVLCGRYGDVTKMAHDREQSRQSLYREASQVANAVDGTAVQSRIDELQRQLAGQQAQIQDLQERLEHAIEITRDKQDEFASVAQAEGVSLSVARRLLQVVAGSVTTPSVPTLGRATEEAGQRAGQLLEVIDEVAQPKVKQATADEIFF